MAQVAGELSTIEVLFSHLGEFADEELSGDLLARIETLLKEDEYKNLLSKFLSKRGQLQLKMQDLFLTESVLGELRSYIQDPGVQATQEAVQIEQLGRREVISVYARRVTTVLLIAGAVAFGVWKFAPRSGAQFKALDYLEYEALMLEEARDDRLNLPSRSVKEIKDYLASYPGLDYSPKVFQSLPEKWDLDGSTVIDYEIAKVSVVQYHHSDSGERLFHFSYAGDLASLPKTEQGNMRGLIFQTYTSDSFNFIAWQASPKVVAMLAGRRSAPELAELAVIGSGK